MRPLASTAVASMQNTAAPDSASELMCVKSQSLASPSTDEYWHIGATMMPLARPKPRNWIGENKALMAGFRHRWDEMLTPCVARTLAALNPQPAQHSPYLVSPAFP